MCGNYSIRVSKIGVPAFRTNQRQQFIDVGRTEAFYDDSSYQGAPAECRKLFSIWAEIERSLRMIPNDRFGRSWRGRGRGSPYAAYCICALSDTRTKDRGGASFSS
jgi:hypothetical protein